MPMRPEVAHAEVLKYESVAGDPTMDLYSLRIPGVGEGSGVVRMRGVVIPSLGYFIASPVRIGIGTRLLRTVVLEASGLGYTEVEGDIIHDESLQKLEEFRRLSRVAQKSVEVPYADFCGLPLVKFLLSGGLEVTDMTVTFIPYPSKFDDHDIDVHYHAAIRTSA
ncbi:hypothetical protein HY948_03775 [Candidatus Gottesmanbacteria bacterium]|nr:hypothetical protein [Candidatus Gottesmanbacteria bacterium]